MKRNQAEGGILVQVFSVETFNPEEVGPLTGIISTPANNVRIPRFFPSSPDWNTLLARPSRRVRLSETSVLVIDFLI